MAGKIAKLDQAGGMVPIYRAGNMSVAFVEGMIVGENSDGHAIIGVSGGELLGLVIAPAAHTGNEEDKDLQIVDARKHIFRFPRPTAVPVEDCQPGMYIDLAAGGLVLAAASDNDFYIEDYDANNDEVHVRATRLVGGNVGS